MYTIVETPTFKNDVDKIWSEVERGTFYNFLAANPDVGDVIPNSGGCRKIRWSKQGIGKRSGVRIIYYNKLYNGEIWLLVIYKKAVKTNIPAHILKSIREVIDNV